MTCSQAKAKRSAAKLDPRYKIKRVTAATLAERKDRATARALREGRSFGYSKK